MEQQNLRTFEAGPEKKFMSKLVFFFIYKSMCIFSETYHLLKSSSVGSKSENQQEYQ